MFLFSSSLSDKRSASTLSARNISDQRQEINTTLIRNRTRIRTQIIIWMPPNLSVNLGLVGFPSWRSRPSTVLIHSPPNITMRRDFYQVIKVSQNFNKGAEELNLEASIGHLSMDLRGGIRFVMGDSECRDSKLQSPQTLCMPAVMEGIYVLRQISSTI
jgi:hypothetical protein